MNIHSKILLTVFLMSSAACADPIVTFGASHGNLSASVSFELVAGNLQVTLTNDSTADLLAPAEVLTAVFFDIAGNPTLSRISAVLAPGSVVLFGGGTDPGGVVGGEWAYRSGLSGPPLGQRQGISSAGFGWFGPGDRFPGADLWPPASVNGLEYGITSAGDNTASGNRPVTGMQPLIRNSVIFTLGNLPAGFSLNDISPIISFAYGTGPETYTHTPEPGSSLLTVSVCALPAVVVLRRRLRR